MKFFKNASNTQIVVVAISATAFVSLAAFGIYKVTATPNGIKLTGSKVVPTASTPDQTVPKVSTKQDNDLIRQTASSG